MGTIVFTYKIYIYINKGFKRITLINNIITSISILSLSTSGKMPSHEVKCHVTVEYKQLPLILASDYKKEISSSSSFQSSYNQVERSVSVSGSAGVPGIFSASLSMSLAFKNVTSQSSGCSDFQFKEESKMVDSIPKDALLTPEQLQKKAEDFMKAEYDNGTGTGMVFGPRCTFSLENQVDEISAEKFYG